MNLLYAVTALASSGYQVDVWRADDGLPQGTVTSIVQTRDGYLWLGTQYGLVRFDGVSFKVFNENNTAAIKNSRIVYVYGDRQGALWVGAEQGNLYSYQNRHFTDYAMPGVGSAFNYARSVCDDPAGNVWVISCEWQLICVSHGRLSSVSTNWKLDGTRPDSVACDRDGNVYVGTEKELAVRQDGQFQAVWNQTNEANFQVDFLASGRQGGCWVAGNARLRRWDQGRWVDDRGSYCWTNLPVYGLYEDSQNCLWVATLGDGLFRYDPDGTKIQITTKDGLPTDFVRCVTEDREGNMWVGMEGGGLCRLKPATFQSLGVHEGLSSDQVMSSCQASDGTYWIGMNGSGLDHYDHGRVTHYSSDQGLMNGHVWSVLQDKAGVIWAGTWGGLFKLVGQQFIRISDGVNIGGVVLAMYEDRTGQLWLGQQAFGGVTRINQGQPITMTIPGTSTSLDVRVIAEDREGGMWFGTENEGLYRWKDGQFTHFSRQNGLGNDSVWSLHVDEAGVLWIGTCGGGLSCWRHGVITTWTTKDGLINDVIGQILEDNRGKLWLGSYGGVFSVDKKELENDGPHVGRKIHCVSYSKSDGLPSIECPGGFEPSGFKSSDGRLWFPTFKGLAVVNPETVATNSVPPLVLVEDLIADGVDQSKEITQNGDNAVPAVEISPGKNHLEFHYTATSLTAPQKVMFKYRLEGLEKDWTDAGVRRTATYGRLPPGQFIFHVLACNNDGVWNEQGARLAITVLPFFWQTGWFIGLSGFVLVVVVFAAVRLVVTRRLQLKLERLEQEQMVQRERARIAKDIHDDLGASLTEISILSELVQNAGSLTGQAQADLNKIATKTKTLTQLLDEIVWAVNPKRDTIENFVTYTCTYAEDYLRVAQVQCRLQLPPAVQDVFLPTNVRHGLFLVVKEVLNNIVRHAGASEVKIGMEIQAAELVIRISDNGRGFSLDSKAGYYMTDSSLEKPAGEGLSNMRQRVEAMNGRFEVFSQPGQGTQVRITVPIGK